LKAQGDITTIAGYTDKIDDATDGLTAIKAEVEGLGGMTPPTAVQIQAEMEENGASILDALRDGLTDARMGYLDNINNANLSTVPDISTLSSTRIGYLDELDFGLTEALAAISGYVDCLPASLNDPTAAAIADAVWDEVLTGATHNDATSAGRRLRQAADVLIVREETCQAGGGNDEVILDAGASAIDDFYVNDIIILESGTGAGQARHIDSYVGASKTVTVNRDWDINPDETTVYIIRFDSTKHVHGFETTAKAEIEAEVADALDAAIPGSPTADSINERIKTIDDHDLVTKIPGVVTAVGPTKAEMDTAHALLATPAQVAAELATYDAATGTELADAETALTAEIDANETKIDENKAILDKLDSAMEADDAVYRFTENALEEAPSGTGASAASIADAVWDEALADHEAEGSTGEALADATEITLEED